MDITVSRVEIRGDDNNLFVKLNDFDASKLFYFNDSFGASTAADLIEAINELHDEDMLDSFEVFRDDSGTFYIRNKETCTASDFNFSEDDAAVAQEMVDFYFETLAQSE